MAQRRMFAKSVVQSDLFLEMPLTTQAVYFHLGMDADDDGFLINAKSVCRLINASEDDIKLLIAKGFLIKFRKGIIVIRDWKQNNYIQNDRYHETVCFAEKKQLVCGKNGQYELMDTKCIQNVSNLYPQVRLELGNNYIKNSNNINTERLNNSKIFPKGNYNKSIVAVFEKFGIDKSKWEELSAYTEQRILDVAAVVNFKKNVQNPSGLFISMLEKNWALPISNEEMNAKKKEELNQYKEKASKFCMSCYKFEEKDILCSHDGMRFDRKSNKSVKCEYCEVV